MKLLGMLLFIILLIACSGNDSSKELIDLKCIDKELFESYDIFLLIPSDYCSDCFRKIINKLEDKKELQNVLIVVLGRNYKDVNSFTNNFPYMQYLKEINPDTNRSIFPVMYYKSGRTIHKKEITNENDLIDIINYE